MNILIASFITYGIVTIVAEYDGPFKLLTKLRDGKMGSLFRCAVCMSPFVALLPFIGMNLTVFEYLASIGVTVVLARNT